MENSYTRKKMVVLGIILGLTTVWALSNLVVENKLSVIKTSLDDSINGKVKILNELAVTTGKGGFNQEAEMMIADCENDERVKFETLLSSLDSGLTWNELNNLDELFGSCGHVFANRRTSMLMQMEREFSFLNDLAEKRKLVGDFDESSVNLEKWNELLSIEKEINDSFQKMVVVQKDIIDSLVSGKPTKSEEVQKLLEEAQGLKVKLSTATEKSSAIRSALITT